MSKILIYGDINLNYIDGSSIWLESIIETLSFNNEIYVLLKSSNVNSRVERLKEIDNVHIINPSTLSNTSFIKKKNLVLSASEAMRHIVDLDNQYKFNSILIRGIKVIEHLIEHKSICNKSIIYGLGDIGGTLSDQQENTLTQVIHSVKFLACQTLELKNYYISLGISPERLFVLPPMIPNIKENNYKKRDKADKPFTLIYTGKLSPGYRVLDFLKAFNNDICPVNPNVRLIIAGSKFYNKPYTDNFENDVTKEINSNKNITWYKELSRSEVQDLISSADLGVSWRSEDFNESLELSTKLLEYGIHCTPMILNSTKMHRELLGDNYPFFANSYHQFVEKVQMALNDSQSYSYASNQVYSMSSEFTFSKVNSQINPYFKQDIQTSNNKKNLLVAGHDFKFIDKLINKLDDLNEFNIKFDKWENHTNHDEDKSKKLLEWADVIFCEWCLGNAVWYSKHKKENQKLFIRVHRQEVTTKFPSKLSLKNINKIIFIAPLIQEEFYRQFNIPTDKTTLIYNSVDTSEFDRPKLEESKYNLGMIGICPKIKRLDYSLDILEKLRKYDPRFKLFVKGALPTNYPWLWRKPTEKFYYKKVFHRINSSDLLKDSVVFDGWGNDIENWLRKVSFVLSVSDIEGSHQAVAEGMASGSIPMITNWQGASQIYPSNFVKENQDEIVSSIISYVEDEKTLEDKRDDVKQYSLSNFDIKNIRDQIVNLINI